MADSLKHWQVAVQEQFPPETAATLVESIEVLLQDDRYTVLRQLAAELLLNQREIKTLATRIQQDSDADRKQQVVFKSPAGDGAEDVTLEMFSALLLQQVAEGRQLLDLLMFYVMALPEA